MSDWGRFFKHTSIYAVGNTLQRAAGFLLLPLYTTRLTTGEYGALELFYSVSAVLMTFLGIGLAHATLRFYFEFEDPERRRAVVATTLVATMAIALPPVVLLLPFAKVLAHVLFEGRYAHGVPIVLTSMVLELLRQVCLAYFRAREYSVRYVASALLQLLVQVVANILTVAVLKWGVVGVLFGNMIAVMVGTGYVMSITLRECGLRFEFGIFKQIFAYCYPFLFTSIVGEIVQNTDRFMIMRFMSLEALGIYALAIKFGQLLRILIVQSFQLGFGAFRFSIIHQDNAKDMISRIATYYLLLVTASGLAISLLCKEVIAVMATPEYSAAAVVVPVIMLAISTGCLGYIFQTGVLFEKTTGKLVKVSFVEASALIGLDLLLIPTYGYMGAAAATVGSALAQLVAIYVVSQRLYPVRYDFRRLGTILATGVAVFLVGHHLIGGPLWASVGAKVLLLAGFALLAVLTRVFYGDEWRGIRGYVRARRNVTGAYST